MSNEIQLIDENFIKSKIYTVRNTQVILDRDLAKFYQTETRTLKQAVRRNIDRFPEDFMFELNEIDIEYMVSQSVIPSKSYFGGAKPFAFTEQGVSMLSGVLRTSTAVDISIKIIKSFVAMKKVLSEYGNLFYRLDTLEKKQLTYDENFEKIFNAIESKNITPEQGIFYDGQIFSAYKFVNDLIRKAKTSIILIDNYIDDTVLTMFSKNKNITYTLYTKTISEKLRLDIKKYNQEYNNLKANTCSNSHDRFLIIDDQEVYQIGASLKDLGKKIFAFFKLNEPAENLINRIK